MTDRISTSQMYNQSVFLMLSKQAKLSHLEQQIATGRRLVSAKDDPVASGAAVGLDRSLAALDQMKLNGSAVQNRLGLQENTLAQVNDLMGRVSELTIQASNPALGAADKKTLVAEIEQIRGGLLALANSTDGTGRYLFGGTQDSDPPFSQVNGRVVYGGDQTQKRVEVGPDTYVLDALPGSEIFLRIPTGDGRVDARADAGNTGTAVLTQVSLDGSGAWDSQPFSVRFTAADTFEVVDATGTVTSTGTRAPGDDIVVNGVRLTV